MFKQAILAAATAGLIATGGLAATTTAASAASVQFGGPGWQFQFGTQGPGPYHQFHEFHQQQFCTPIVKKVKWWDRFGYPHWSQVVVGQNCGGNGYGAYHKRPHPQWGGNGNWRGNNGGDQGVIGGDGNPGAY